MTKKSHGRQMRDAQKKEDAQLFEQNTCWSDLQELQNQCLDLIQTNAMFARQLLDPSLEEFFDNYRAVTINMQTLAGDLTRISNTYQSILSKHSTKSGKAQTHEEMMECFSISSEYAAFIEDVNGTVLPIVTMLMESYAIAIERQAQAALAAKANVEEPRLSPEQDPNLITDVVVREV